MVDKTTVIHGIFSSAPVRRQRLKAVERIIPPPHHRPRACPPHALSSGRRQQHLSYPPTRIDTFERVLRRDGRRPPGRSQLLHLR
jgi:hypothetical protein